MQSNNMIIGKKSRKLLKSDQTKNERKNIVSCPFSILLFAAF